jgi:hypothetical protein
MLFLSGNSFDNVGRRNPDKRMRFCCSRLNCLIKRLVDRLAPQTQLQALKLSKSKNTGSLLIKSESELFQNYFTFYPALDQPPLLSRI